MTGTLGVRNRNDVVERCELRVSSGYGRIDWLSADTTDPIVPLENVDFGELFSRQIR
jgi:hypothetical protein